MNIQQTSTFSKQVKKLYKNQKEALDEAIKKIVTNPYIGDLKKGDLNNTYVYKFQMVNQLTLLAYEFYGDQLLLILLELGSHENFYRDLKKNR
jgi:mRNA-degrading endonuclease YafQ of YafQ-DinJ toxin-antitoxin module